MIEATVEDEAGIAVTIRIAAGNVAEVMIATVMSIAASVMIAATTGTITTVAAAGMIATGGAAGAAAPAIEAFR